MSSGNMQLKIEMFVICVRLCLFVKQLALRLSHTQIDLNCSHTPFAIGFGVNVSNNLPLNSSSVKPLFLEWF